MAYLIGTDEAGYGPNLGPLVVSATLWRVPDDLYGCELYQLLEDSVVRCPAASGDPRLAIADSKQLYKPGGGLAALEHAVLAALDVCPQPQESLASLGATASSAGAATGDLPLAASGSAPQGWRDIWSRLDWRLDDEFFAAAWYADYSTKLPCDASRKAIEAYAKQLAAGLLQAGAELLAVRSRVLSAARFNRLLTEHENKATVLSRTTFDLIAELLASAAGEPVLICCDKHGGRNRYGPLLQQAFPDYLIEVRREERSQSVYRWGPAERRIEIQFTVGGEAALPAALASMTSKYLRELAMQAFNAFWLREVPGLKPTAGYPVDARRFHRSIAARQAELGIDDGVLWRRR